jgi:alpha-1,2-mannosyltransferase
MGPRSASRGPSDTRPAPERTRAVISVAALLAAAVTFYQLSRPGSLLGTSADVAVYLGGSVRLVHGVLPYRDFVFVQPPGFMLLATPFAFLSELTGTRDALAVLRLTTPFLAAASVVLVGRLVRHRGVAATLIACGVMALFPTQLYALHSVLLEPVLEFFCLVGAVVAFEGDRMSGSRRTLAAGVAFGFAGSIKVSAILPVLVLAVLCLPEVRRRLLPFAGGVIAGFAVPTLPFLLAAPGAFVGDVVATQLGRIPSTARVPLPVRLGDLTGASAFASGDAVAVTVAAVLGGLVVCALLASRRWPTRLEWFALGSTLLVSVAQLLPAQYYPHYAALVTPFLAVLLGLCVAAIPSAGMVTRLVAPALAGAVVLALLVNQVSYLTTETSADVVVAVDSVIPEGGCAMSDAPRNLVTTDRFVSSRPGCTDMTDPNGTALALGNTAEAAAVWRSAFAEVDYVIVEAPVTTWPIDPVATAYVAENFRLVRSSGLLIYVRKGVAAGRPAG